MVRTDCRPLAAGIVLAASLLPAAVRAQSSTIEVSYVEVQNAISPRAGVFRVPRTTQVRLEGENALAVTNRSQYGKGKVVTSSRQVRPSESIESGAATSRWRVGGPNVLIRETALARHTVRTTIRVSGSSCQASVTFHLKPGETQYQMPWAQTGEPALFRALRAEKVSCRIVGG